MRVVHLPPDDGPIHDCLGVSLLSPRAHLLPLRAIVECDCGRYFEKVEVRRGEEGVFWVELEVP